MEVCRQEKVDEDKVKWVPVGDPWHARFARGQGARRRGSDGYEGLHVVLGDQSDGSLQRAGDGDLLEVIVLDEKDSQLDATARRCASDVLDALPMSRDEELAHVSKIRAHVQRRIAWGRRLMSPVAEMQLVRRWTKAISG